jgi:hypothetical protein
MSHGVATADLVVEAREQTLIDTSMEPTERQDGGETHGQDSSAGASKEPSSYEGTDVSETAPCVPAKEKAINSTLKEDFKVYEAAVQRLNSQLGEIPVVQRVAEITSLPPLAVALMCGFSAAAFCFFGFGGQLLSIVLGILFPAFESFKVLEEFSNVSDPSEIYGKASSMQFWLIYWIVVGLFSSFEYLFYIVLKWIPLYFPLKLAILLWLYMPATRGANTVYHWIVAPTLRQNRQHIDAAIEKSGHHIRTNVSHAVRNVALSSFDLGAEGATQLGRAVFTKVPQLTEGIRKRMNTV